MLSFVKDFQILSHDLIGYPKWSTFSYFIINIALQPPLVFFNLWIVLPTFGLISKDGYPLPHFRTQLKMLPLQRYLSVYFKFLWLDLIPIWHLDLHSIVLILGIFLYLKIFFIVHLPEIRDFICLVFTTAFEMPTSNGERYI